MSSPSTRRIACPASKSLKHESAVGMAVVLALGLLPLPSAAQQAAKAKAGPLVFDHVTVVDVEHGTLVADRRVVVTGNRIAAVDPADAKALPANAQVIDGRGKYLIPGLWDMHYHTYDTGATYRQYIAAGITGIRDAGTGWSLASLLQVRRDILAGRLVGPPRQILSGQSIMGPTPGCERGPGPTQTCVTDSADAIRFVDSLKAAGADMIKPREVRRALYFTVAAEARRVGISFGGHASFVTELEASDSGARIVDHAWGDAGCAYHMMSVDFGDGGGIFRQVGGRQMTFRDLQEGDSTWEACHRQAAARFRHNHIWFVPTFGAGPVPVNPHVSSTWKAPGFPLLAGTDMLSSLQDQLNAFVQSGLTPALALQTATLNPAKMLGGTDSLGTVAAGKLADLVLLDADPLADIGNVQWVRAVVANGRYFDRATLDTFVPEPQAEATDSVP